MLSGGVLFGKQTRLDQSERSMHFPFTGAPRRHICQIWVSFSQHGVLFLTRPPIFFPGFCMLRKDWPDPVTCVCFGGGQKNLIISQQWKKKEPGLKKCRPTEESLLLLFTRPSLNRCHIYHIGVCFIWLSITDFKIERDKTDLLNNLICSARACLAIFGVFCVKLNIVLVNLFLLPSTVSRSGAYEEW